MTSLAKKFWLSIIDIDDIGHIAFRNNPPLDDFKWFIENTFSALIVSFSDCKCKKKEKQIKVSFQYSHASSVNF